MRLALRAAVAALLLSAAPLAADDAAAIRAVIEDQLADFQSDDWTGAFEHASPNIQSIFRTPEGFGRMVRGGYPMVWRPSRVEAGPLEDGPNGPVQIMRLRDADGAEYVAAYRMTLVDGRWRIDGVHIRRVEDATA
jgi:hypothetical protein